jgi:hypothetical protein
VKDITVNTAVKTCFFTVKQVLGYNNDDAISMSISKMYDKGIDDLIEFLNAHKTKIHFISRKHLVDLISQYYGPTETNYIKAFDYMYSQLEIDKFYWD